MYIANNKKENEMKTKDIKEDCSSETKIINTPFPQKDVYGAINMPIYRNAAFEYPDSKTIAEAFQYKTELYTYSRITNPTVTHLEDKIKQASGAESTIALASGMAAISNTFLTLASAGTNIISSPHLFGNTFSFLASTLADFGIETRFVDMNDINEIERAIDENTCALFAEIITNPHLEIADFPQISKILKEKNIPLVVDSTLIPWGSYDPEKLGIDIEVVSTTKYISGGATSIGGAIVDYGTHDWLENKKLNKLPKPKGMSRFMFKLRGEIARNLGACMAPDVAYLESLGMETLQLRYTKMANSAFQIASTLSKHPKVEKVHYPQLATSAYKDLADRLFKNNPGAMFTINLSSKDECYKFMDKLKVIRRATNLFDNKSLVIHPESTIYATFSAEKKKTMGIEDTLLRFSVGLENIADLIADIEQALQ